MTGLLNIGFGNMINAEKLVAVVSPDAAPIKRLIQGAKGNGLLVDATQGRKTNTVLVMDTNQIILSALQPETITKRFWSNSTLEDRGEAHE